MRIRILRQTSIEGRPVRPGDVVAPSDRDARFLVAIGKAEEVQDPIPDPVARKPRTRKPTSLEA